MVKKKLEPHQVMLLAGIAQCSHASAEAVARADGDVTVVRGANLRARLRAAWEQLHAQPNAPLAISSVPRPKA